MKMLLYKSYPDQFDLLNFEDDESFLEPLLFAWFNADQNNTTLEQLIYSKIIKSKQNGQYPVHADDKGFILCSKSG